MSHYLDKYRQNNKQELTKIILAQLLTYRDKNVNSVIALQMCNVANIILIYNKQETFICTCGCNNDDRKILKDKFFETIDKKYSIPFND
jgi:hypothetical protein